MTTQEINRLEAIVRIHRSIGATLDVAEVARIVVRELSGMFDCDACAIMLIEANGVRILAEKGFSKTFGKMEFHRDIPAINHILTTGESILTNDISNSPAAGCMPYGCFMNSLICTPIMLHEDVKGIIHLDSIKKDEFKKDDLEFTELMAKEIAVAIERSLLYSEVVDVSIRDGLTGCYNRRKFDLDIVAETAGARKGKKPISLLMMDIDWFKNYNDFHGHPKGDDVLKKLTQVLNANLRPGDKVYRYGGEEFAILLPDTGKVKAVYAATRLRELIELEPFYGEKESQPEKRVTISIGVATFPVDTKEWQGLIEAADSALYTAKYTGRNKACAFAQKVVKS
ncbi:sensor domain-containing diguanylate cyclase [Chloroflexota bacterium]